jgi:predicted Zn-dependent peptidase
MVGDFALADMEREVRRCWGGLPRGTAPPPAMPACPRLEKSSEQRLELDLQESHLFIGWQAPAFNDEQRLSFSLLTHLLGRGLNPVLSGVLRGRRRLVERLSMSYSPLRGGGMAVLHLVLDEKNVRSALSELASFLSNIRDFQFSREDVLPQFRSGMLDYLESAKNQMEFSDGQFRESALNLSLAAARFLLLNRITPGRSYLESVAKVSSSDLRRVAGRFLSGKKWAVLAIVPPAGRKK